jgi:protein-tyrosine phosphatase
MPRSGCSVLTSLSSTNRSKSSHPGCLPSCKSCSCVHACVSRKKRRFIRDGFDLDLAYITNRIIATGFPAQGREACYRNSASSTHEFLAQRHAGHYKIWNLCSEPRRHYSKDLFFGPVEVIGFPDHNAPRMEQMLQFCQSMDEWLAKDADNVAVVHCKAGKVRETASMRGGGLLVALQGRTGTMISGYLLWCGACDSAVSAITFFGRQRTHDGKGVTIPSQQRFVRYLELWIRAKARAGSLLLKTVGERARIAAEAEEEEAEAVDAITLSLPTEQVAAGEALVQDEKEVIPTRTSSLAEDDAPLLPAADDADSSKPITPLPPPLPPMAADEEVVKLEEDDAIGPWTGRHDPTVLPRRPVTITSVALSGAPKLSGMSLFVAVYDADGVLVVSSSHAEDDYATFRDVSTGVPLEPSKGGLASSHLSVPISEDIDPIVKPLLSADAEINAGKALQLSPRTVGTDWVGGIPAAVRLLQRGYRSTPTTHTDNMPSAARAASGIAAAPKNHRVKFHSASRMSFKKNDPPSAAAKSHHKGADLTHTVEMTSNVGADHASELHKLPYTSKQHEDSNRPSSALLCPGDGYQLIGYGPLQCALPRKALGRRTVEGTLKLVLLAGLDPSRAKPLCWLWIETAFLPFPSIRGAAAAAQTTKADVLARLGGRVTPPKTPDAMEEPAPTLQEAEKLPGVSGDSKHEVTPSLPVSSSEAAELDGALPEVEGAPAPAQEDSLEQDDGEQEDARKAEEDGAEEDDDDDEDDGVVDTMLSAKSNSSNAGMGASVSVAEPELCELPSAAAVVAPAPPPGEEERGRMRVGWAHFPKPRIDKALKDKHCKVFPANFSITLFYEAFNPATAADGMVGLDVEGGCAAVATRLTAEGVDLMSVV